MDALLWLAVLLLASPAFGVFGAWIAGQRHRSKMEGAILGCLFGPLGVLVEVLLPEGEPPVRANRSHEVPISEDDGSFGNEPLVIKIDGPDGGIQLGIVDDWGPTGKRRPERVIAADDLEAEAMRRALRKLQDGA